VRREFNLLPSDQGARRPQLSSGDQRSKLAWGAP
jgi:hypothetical protein